MTTNRALATITGLLSFAGCVGDDNETGAPVEIITANLTSGSPLADYQARGIYEAVGTLPGCSATLISQEAVLTAAHCVCPASSPVGCQSRTTFTLKNVKRVDNPATSNVDESLWPPADVSIGGSVQVHPQFGALGWLRSDYAVVTLDRPVYDLAFGVVPQPVAPASRAPAVGATLLLAGYGRTGSDCSLAGVGQLAAAFPSEVVAEAIRFDDTGVRACPGDSGGAALDLDKFVLGVASWNASRTDGTPIESTYRPAYEVQSWIRGIINPLETASDIARFDVSLGGSWDLGYYDPTYTNYRPAVGIVGQAISPSDGYVYTWYRNGTYSAGRSWDLAGSVRQETFTVPGGYWPYDIVGMGFSSTNQVYTWYRNGRVSVGTPSDLDAVSAPYSYSVIPGHTPLDLVGVDIASDDKVYAWYRDGALSIGRSWDLDVDGVFTYSLPAGKTPADVVEIAIGRTPSVGDQVYTWYRHRTGP